jgi:N-acylglucosamine-6-phosphate 2-epimerase
MDEPVSSVLPAGIVISCQATPPNPLAGPEGMSLMARAAAAGGAVGIRANGAADIAAIRAVTDLPIIGINKVGRGEHPVYITPTIAAARAVAAAGCRLLAIDATLRPRPDGGTVEQLIRAIHDELRLPVMADVDDVEAGLAAAAAGADLVATTLSGYTGGRSSDLPDIALVEALSGRAGVPIVAEGRYWGPEAVGAAFQAGAYAVVVGTAVTNPMAITQRMVRAVPC